MDYEKYIGEPIISIQFMYPKDVLDEMYFLSQNNVVISRNSHLLYFKDVFLSDQYWLEYNPVKASKEVMLHSLIERKGYIFQNVIVFGDNYNDLGMLKLAGTSVVVENAPEEIKKIADHIIPSNQEGGVLQFIEQHLDELI
jgi:hydroxymethylpyrimidine pyrophosphatase-like HAD family hydrolase